MSTHVTQADLLALALPKETRLRVIRRFALWCAEQVVAARIARGWQCPTSVWFCLLRTRRCLDDRSPRALAKLDRAMRKAPGGAPFAASAASTAFAGTASAYAATVASEASAFAGTASAYAATVAADATAQREALTQIVLEELALTSVQDWRPSETLPEDYYALRTLS